MALPALVSGSTANIYGVCNQYSSEVTFKNTENGGNDCSAPKHGKCNAHRAWIPKCEQASDYSHHHMEVRSADGHVNYKIWKDDGKAKIRGGSDYGKAHDVTDIVKGGAWNIVISPTGKVSLYETADPNNCPAPEKHCSKIGKKSGEWKYVQSVSSTQSVSFRHGVTRSYTNTNTKTWSQSVTVSVSAGFNVLVAKGDVSVSSTTAYEEAKAYSSTFEETDETTFTDQFKAGTIWQWVWTIEDECGRSIVKGTDVVRTRGTFEPPCCLPGFALDPKNYAGKCGAAKGSKAYVLCPKSETYTNASTIIV